MFLKVGNLQLTVKTFCLIFDIFQSFFSGRARVCKARATSRLLQLSGEQAGRAIASHYCSRVEFKQQQQQHQEQY